jgi:CRISPR-associated protein Cas2
MDTLVTYDISTADLGGEKRLAKVAAVCERYGSRVQYSVFECRLSPVAMQRLITELEEVIDRRADSVRIYRFAGDVQHSLTTLGRGAPRDLGDPWIL